MIAAISESPVIIRNFLDAADTNSTLAALTACGVKIEKRDGWDAGAAGCVPRAESSGEAANAGSGSRTGSAERGTSPAHAGGSINLIVHGAGLRGLNATEGVIDVGNSGTTMRMLPGIFAGQNGTFTLDGDESIRLRPMERIVDPLKQMGIDISARDGRFAPVAVTGGPVRGGFHYDMPVASAQVKSALLLAGLFADGPTEVVEPAVCRDHTEIMLAAAGARIEKEELLTRIHPVDHLRLDPIEIMADISSAAFWLLAGTIISGSDITLTGVGVNPTRTGFIDILLEMGAEIRLDNERLQSGEPVADLRVRHAKLHGLAVGGGITGRAIDELPLLALAGAFAEGETLVSGASELRVKESDRIAGLVESLTSIGVHIEAFADGFVVRGIHGPLKGRFRCRGDHRLAMLGAIAGLASREGVVVEDMDCVSVSYPTFLTDLEKLGGIF